MALRQILKHTGHVVGRVVESDNPADYIEGDSEATPVDGPNFKCCLFLGTSDESERGSRRRRGPELLVGPEDVNGNQIDILPTDRIAIVAPEISIDATVLWQVDGDAQPLHKPGRKIKGKHLRLKRIEDRETREPGTL